MDTVAGAKPTATESPGAREGMIDDPSARSSSDVGGSGSAEIDGGNRSNSGSSNDSDSGSSSGGAADADDGVAGQMPRLEANRLKWTISPPNLPVSRTRGETGRLAEADSFPSIGDIALEVEALLAESQCTESEKGITGHEFDDIWEMFGSSGSQRWSESKDA